MRLIYFSILIVVYMLSAHCDNNRTLYLGQIQSKMYDFVLFIENRYLSDFLFFAWGIIQPYILLHVEGFVWWLGVANNGIWKGVDSNKLSNLALDRMWKRLFVLKDWMNCWVLWKIASARCCLTVCWWQNGYLFQQFYTGLYPFLLQHFGKTIRHTTSTLCLEDMLKYSLFSLCQWQSIHVCCNVNKAPIYIYCRG